MRADLRERLRQDGQWRLDGGDHPGGDRAAAQVACRREREPGATRQGSGHELGRRDRAGRRLQRAGSAGPPSPRGSRRECHDSDREPLGHPRRSRDSRAMERGAGRDGGVGVQGRGSPHGGVLLDRGGQRAPRKEHVRPGPPRLDLRPRPGSLPPADRERLPQEVAGCGGGERPIVRRGLCLGRSQPRLPDRSRDDSGARAYGRDERQRCDRARRRGGGDGAGGDVSDHARHVCFPPPRRDVRAIRGCAPSGGGRDRGGRCRHRRLVRGQGRLHDHIGARVGAQDGVPRAGHHGRDPPGRGGRAARWSEHGPAHQGRAIRSAGGIVRPAG